MQLSWRYVVGDGGLCGMMLQSKWSRRAVLMTTVGCAVLVVGFEACAEDGASEGFLEAGCVTK